MNLETNFPRDRHRRLLTYFDTPPITCPHCGAPPGQDCTWLAGARMPGLSPEEIRRTTHVARTRRAATIWNRLKRSEIANERNEQ